MFEITYSDSEIFENYQYAGKAHKGGTYDFTFENRYLIYHASLRREVNYIAIDMTTGLSSSVITKAPGSYYTKESYRKLIPHILYSVKYTGDVRYLNRFVDKPLEVIDSIFRVVLPNNGYAGNPPLDRLCAINSGISPKIAMPLWKSAVRYDKIERKNICYIYDCSIHFDIERGKRYEQTGRNVFYCII